MLLNDSIDWDKKSLEFIRNTTGNLINLTLEDALKLLIAEAIRLCEASECYFLNLNSLFINDYSPIINGNQGQLLYNYFRNDLFNIKDSQIEMSLVNGHDLFTKSSLILKIPLQCDALKGLLVLGFDSSITLKRDYCDFAQLVQGKCHEVIGFLAQIKSLSKSKEYLNVNSFSPKENFVFNGDSRFLAKNEFTEAEFIHDFQISVKNEKNRILELSNLLSSVLNCTLSGIMAFKSVRDDQGEIIDFVCLISNVPANRIFKFDGQNCRGKLFKKLLPLNIRQQLFDHFVEVVEENINYNSEYSYDWKEKIKWFYTIGIKLEDGFVATFTEVTDRKLSEENLVYERAQLKGILENTNDLIFSINQSNQVINLNSAFRTNFFNITGINLVIGDILDFSIFPDFIVSQWKFYLKKAFQGDHLVKETIIPVKSSQYHYQFSLNPIKSINNIVTEVAIFGHDISKRKAAQIDIKQKSQLLNGILDYLPVLIFRINSDHTLLEFNGSGLKKIQIDKNKIIGEKATKIFPELDHVKLSQSKGVKTRFLSKGESDGIPWVFEIFIFSDETNSNGFVGFGMDITEQQQLELNLYNAKEIAEKASLAKTYFLANQSHEIRTPINSILGFAQLIKNKSRVEESDEYLDYIISSGQSLLSIVGNILDLTKIEEGKLELLSETFNFAQKIKKEIIPYRFQAIDKGLSFDLEIEENFPSFFIGDIEKISQIIINLLGNSLKFTHEGSIKLACSCQSINSESKIAKVRISISDTGIGIPLKIQKEIFSNFKQADNSIAKRFGGSGLGLAIVKELVHLMGGEIGVSSPGELQSNHREKGSTFWFVIPLKLAKPQKIKELKNFDLSKFHVGSDIEVLLVDDNHVNRRLGSTLLSNIGCKVTIAENGDQAIKILRTKSFSLILMDVQMPVLDGCETTAILRNELKINVPIIGLSANVQKQNIDYCLEIGMNDYLGRPYSLSDFYDKIFRWAKLNGKNTIYPEVYNSNGYKTLTGLSFLNKVFKGDKDKISEMIEEYLEHQDITLEKISLAISKSEFTKVSELAHELRSSIQTVGLDSLNDLLIELETESIDSKNKSLINKLFSKVKNVCNQASYELKDFISLANKN